MTGSKIAAIDLGTVSSRLLCATMRDGVPADSRKHTVITDLGEGVDATGRFTDAAVGRVLHACAEFIEEARAYGAQAVSTTLTSAARDASNGAELLDGLRSLGLIPQVIPGEVEARLTFYGVAHDFPAQRIAVMDSGGGSTEFALGSYVPGTALELDEAQSLDIGCRRATERFFNALPPAGEELEALSAWAHEQFARFWGHAGKRPDRLVAVGGTVTSLVALVHELAVYDSHFVHLRDLTQEQVDGCIERMAGMTAEQIAALPGIQAKRAPVILAGAVVIREAMRTGGYDSLTVSENSLLAGAAATIAEALAGKVTSIGWTPELAML